MKSMTDSQKSKKLLGNSGISTQIVSLDKSLTKRGCAFGIVIPETSSERAIKILDREGLYYGELLSRD